MCVYCILTNKFNFDDDDDDDDDDNDDDKHNFELLTLCDIPEPCLPVRLTCILVLAAYCMLLCAQCRVSLDPTTRFTVQRRVCPANEAPTRKNQPAPSV